MGTIETTYFEKALGNKGLSKHCAHVALHEIASAGHEVRRAHGKRPAIEDELEKIVLGPLNILLHDIQENPSLNFVTTKQAIGSLTRLISRRLLW
jgi:hypothetical protein